MIPIPKKKSLVLSSNAFNGFYCTDFHIKVTEVSVSFLKYVSAATGWKYLSVAQSRVANRKSLPFPFPRSSGSSGAAFNEIDLC